MLSVIFFISLFWNALSLDCASNEFIYNGECKTCEAVNLVPNQEGNGCTYAWLKQTPNLVCYINQYHRQCINIVSKDYQCSTLPSYTDGYINTDKCEIFKECIIDGLYSSPRKIYFTEYGLRYKSGEKALLNVSCIEGTSGTPIVQQNCSANYDFQFDGCIPDLIEVESISETATASLQSAHFVVRKEDFLYVDSSTIPFDEDCQQGLGSDFAVLCNNYVTPFECQTGYSNLNFYEGQFRRNKLYTNNSNIDGGVLTQTSAHGCQELSKGVEVYLSMDGVEENFFQKIDIGAVFLEPDNLDVSTSTIERTSFVTNENDVQVQFALDLEGKFTHETESDKGIDCPYTQTNITSIYSFATHTYHSRTNHSCVTEICERIDLDSRYKWIADRVFYGHQKTENDNFLACNSDEGYTPYHFDGTNMWKNEIQTGTDDCSRRYDLSGCSKPKETFEVIFNGGSVVFADLRNTTKINTGVQVNNTLDMVALEIKCTGGRAGGNGKAKVTWESTGPIIAEWDNKPCQECEYDGDAQFKSMPVIIPSAAQGDNVCEPALDKSSYEFKNLFSRAVRSSTASYEDYTFECKKKTSQEECTQMRYRICKDQQNTDECSLKTFCEWKQTPEAISYSNPCQKIYKVCNLEQTPYKIVGTDDLSFGTTDNIIIECKENYINRDISTDSNGEIKAYLEQILSYPCMMTGKFNFICVPKCQEKTLTDDVATYLNGVSYNQDKLPLYYDVADTTIVVLDWPETALLQDFRPLGPENAWVHYPTYESVDLSIPQTTLPHLEFFYKKAWPLADGSGQEAMRVDEPGWGDCSLLKQTSNYIQSDVVSTDYKTDVENNECNTIGDNGMSAFAACASCGGGKPIPAKESRECGFQAFDESKCSNYLPGRDWTDSSEQEQHCREPQCLMPQQNIKGYELKGTLNLTFENVNKDEFQPYECDTRSHFGTADVSCIAADYPIRLNGCHPKWCKKPTGQNITFTGYGSENELLFMPNWIGSLDNPIHNEGFFEPKCLDTHYTAYNSAGRLQSPQIQTCNANNTEVTMVVNHCIEIPSETCVAPSDTTGYSKTGNQKNYVHNYLPNAPGVQNDFTEDLRLYPEFGVENWTCAENYTNPFYDTYGVAVRLCERDGEEYTLEGCVQNNTCTMLNSGNGYFKDRSSYFGYKAPDWKTLYRQDGSWNENTISTHNWKESQEKIILYEAGESEHWLYTNNYSPITDSYINYRTVMTWVCEKGYEGSAIASHCMKDQTDIILSGCSPCNTGYFKDTVENGVNCTAWKPSCPSGQGYITGDATTDSSCTTCEDGTWKNGDNTQQCQPKTTSCNSPHILFESNVNTHDNQCCDANSEPLSASNDYSCVCKVVETPNGPLTYDGSNSYFGDGKTCQSWTPCPNSQGRLTWGSSTTDVTCEACGNSDKKYSQENDFTACQDHTTCPDGQGVKLIDGEHVFLDNSAAECENCTADVNFSPATSYNPCQAVAVCNYNTQYKIPGTKTTDRQCLQLDTCDYSKQYQSTIPEEAVNRVCANVSHCGGANIYGQTYNISALWENKESAALDARNDFYVAAEHTEEADRQCLPLTTCTYGHDFNKDATNYVPSDYPLGTYESVAPQWNEARQMYVTDRQCMNITDCEVYQYETSPPFWNRDRVCANRATCSLTEYESVAPTKLSERQCEDITECLTDEYEFSPLQNYTDDAGVFQYNVNRVCRKIRECDFDVEYESAEPTWNGKRFVTNRICTSLTICNNDIEYISTKKTNTSDRSCSPRGKQCDYGERINLPTFNDTICTACPSGKMSRGIDNAECRCIYPALEKSDGTCHSSCDKQVVTTTYDSATTSHIVTENVYETRSVPFDSEVKRLYYEKKNAYPSSLCAALNSYDAVNIADYADEHAVAIECAAKCVSEGANQLKGFQIKQVQGIDTEGNYNGNGRVCECVSKFNNDCVRTSYSCSNTHAGCSSWDNIDDVQHYDFQVSTETYQVCETRGCTNTTACNFQENVDVPDESTCIFPQTSEWRWCTCDYRTFYDQVSNPRKVGFIYQKDDGKITCDPPETTNDVNMYGYIRRANSQDICIDECASWSGSLESGFNQRSQLNPHDPAIYFDNLQAMYAFIQDDVRLENNKDICDALDKTKPVVSHKCLGLGIGKTIQHTFCDDEDISTNVCNVPDNCVYSGGECIKCDMGQMDWSQDIEWDIKSSKIYVRYPGTYDIQMFGDFNQTSYLQHIIPRDGTSWSNETATKDVPVKLYSKRADNGDDTTYMNDGSQAIEFTTENYYGNAAKRFYTKPHIQITKNYPNSISRYGVRPSGGSVTYSELTDGSTRYRARPIFQETGTSFKICRRGCTLTTPPEHGSLGDCEGQTLAPGDTCLPECDAGYMPDRRTMCGYDGLQETTCIAEDVCVVTAPADGNMGDCPETLLSDQTCKPTCNTGFVRQGITTCNDGEVSVASCVAIPDVYLYGYVVRQQSDQTCKAECVRWRGTLDDDFDEPTTGNGAAIIESVTDASSCAELQTQDIHHSEDCPKSSCVLQNPTGDCTRTMSSGTTCQPCQTATHATKIWCASGTVTHGQSCPMCPDGQFERVAGDLASCTTCNEVITWYNSNCHRQCNGDCETYKQAYNTWCVCL